MFNTLLVQPLFNLLALIYAILPGHNFGVAVIILTILVRLALWPLVAKQLHSQKAMQELAPDVARVKKQAKGDKQKESRLLMELYKEKEINPFASLLPLLIQLPLFIALFVVLRDILKSGEFAKLAYEAVKQLGPIKVILANGGHFSTQFLGIINLAKPSVFLAVTAAVSQYLQTKQLQPKKTVDQAAKTMNTMGTIFPALTFIIALRLPAALALYWTVTSLVSILQQHIELNRDVEDLEKKK